MPWMSPDSHNDPDEAWDNEVNAYDENTGTYAETTTSHKELELHLDTTILCNKVRFWATAVGGAIEYWLRVFYGDAWHTISAWVWFTQGEWVEVDLGGTFKVTKASIGFRSNPFFADFTSAQLYEFDFWQVVIGAGYPPGVLLLLT